MIFLLRGQAEFNEQISDLHFTRMNKFSLQIERVRFYRQPSVFINLDVSKLVIIHTHGSNLDNKTRYLYGIIVFRKRI